MPANQDLIRLVQFLKNAETLLEEVRDSRNDLLPKHLRNPVRDAWPAVQEAFLTTRTEIERKNAVLREMLTRAGLTGSNLDLKLNGFEHAWARYISVRSDGAVHKIPKWLRRVLGWMNILLGSLASVVPAAELIKEYKEAIEQGVEEVEDGEP